MGYLKCLYLQPRVGETFDATISSALEFGLFVQLKEAPIDGLVHISAIPGDYWELESGGMGLVGQRTGRRWQMGDEVRVRLSRVDLTQRQIDFELLDADAAASHGTVRAPRLRRRPRPLPARRGRRWTARCRRSTRRWWAAGRRAWRGCGCKARRPAGRAGRYRRRPAGGGGQRRRTARRRAWLITNATSYTVCMPSARYWNARRNECWSSGWPRHAMTRAPGSCANAPSRRACGFRLASAESLAKLVGDVAHQGAVAAVRPLKSWDEHDSAREPERHSRAIPGAAGRCCWCWMA